MIAFLFPGQGSQAAGMGSAIAAAEPAARAVFAQVDEA
ncbi:MAG: acyltransferase domain-containing protein, partial [Acidobacteriota bacterium]